MPDAIYLLRAPFNFLILEPLICYKAKPCNMTERNYKSNFRPFGQMKRKDGTSQRREEKNQENQRRERSKEKKLQVHGQIEKLRDDTGLLRVRSHVAK